MQQELSEQYKKLFDEIKEIDDGVEMWSARVLMERLGYDRWENFDKVILKAMKAADMSGVDSIGQFRETTKVIIGGKGAKYRIRDYKLTRYACYLIAQNADSTKPETAAAQTYFAIQTYRQEQMDQMSLEEKRLYIRSQVAKENVKLFQSAKDSGVYRFGTFTDAGYLGLYGMRAKHIKEKKKIGSDDILNRAGITELAANLFRITQTQEKLKGELDGGHILGDHASAQTHFMVGGKIRQTIKDIGGTLPEELPAEEDIKMLERRMKEDDKKRLPNTEKPSKIKANFGRTIEVLASQNDTQE